MTGAADAVLAQVHPKVWHADALATPAGRVLATGDAALDAQLPGGGWPVGAMSEVLQAEGVHSEWRLLLPALVCSGTAAVVLVGTPYMPFGPALAAQGLQTRRLLWVQAQASAQRLWAAEQALRCADVDAVLAWLPQARADQLRRLQMAAAEFDKPLWVLRPEEARHESSPAVLRLLVGLAAANVEAGSRTGGADAPDRPDSLAVQVLKRRGPPLAKALQLHARPAWLAGLLAAGQPGPGYALDCATARA